MMSDPVYKLTTISNESSVRRPWDFTEVASPPVTRSRWFHSTLFVFASLIIGIGLMVIIIGIYNKYHSNEPEDINIENHSSRWLVTVLGIVLSIMGVSVALLCYLKRGNPRSLCCPHNSRSVIRYADTTSLYYNGQTNQEANLLASDNIQYQPISTQYSPVKETGDDHINNLN